MLLKEKWIIFSLFLYPSQINFSSFEYIISCLIHKMYNLYTWGKDSWQMTGVMEQMQNCISQPIFVPVLCVLKDVLYIVKYWISGTSVQNSILGANYSTLKKHERVRRSVCSRKDLAGEVVVRGDKGQIFLLWKLSCCEVGLVRLEEKGVKWFNSILRKELKIIKY